MMHNAYLEKARLSWAKTLHLSRPKVDNNASKMLTTNDRIYDYLFRVPRHKMVVTRDVMRSEEELAIHVRKAVNMQETAPKQKHVRSKHMKAQVADFYDSRLYCFCLGSSNLHSHMASA